MTVSALLVSNAHRVYASDLTIFKCTGTNTSVSFQDFPCVDSAQSSIVTMQAYTSTATNNLREHEVRALDRSHQRSMQEQEHVTRKSIAKHKSAGHDTHSAAHQPLQINVSPNMNTAVTYKLILN